MIRMIRTTDLRRLRSDTRGATLVEFAMIILPLSMALLGLTDLGYRAYVSSVVEGTLHRAARMATVGDKTSAQIDTFVTQQLAKFTNGSAPVITKTNYYEFSGVGKPEKLITDLPPLGSWNTGDCYQDLNGNGRWDSVAGRDGLGGSDDIVFYQVSLSYPRLVPMGKLLGWADSQTITANTVMRNQPYSRQVTPVTRCVSS